MQLRENSVVDSSLRLRHARNKKNRFAFLLLAFYLCFWSTQSGAQTKALGFSGYAKNLGLRSSSLLTNESFIFNISRLRTRGLLDVGRRNHTEIWLDSELLAGDFVGSPEFEFLESIERPTFLDLRWKIKTGNNYQLQQSLFRAFTTFYLGSAELTLGRQRIAWGTGFAWNPTDLLNPFNPAAIELDEKQGTDAAYLAVPLGTLSRVEAAFAPGRKSLKSSAAVRAASNFGDYDFSFMSGKFRDDWAVGGDFAGYIGGAGFRGEFAYTFKDVGSNFFRAILNADYNFANGIYAFLEVYYNGQGTTDKSKYNPLDLLNGETFNLARHYLAASVIKSITPLLGVNIYSIINLNDRSSLIGPALTYSFATNLEIAASAYILLGAENSEFGARENIFFGFLQYYF